MQGPRCLVCIRDDPLQSTLILPEIDLEEAHWSTSEERTMISVSHEHSQPISCLQRSKGEGATSEKAVHDADVGNPIHNRDRPTLATQTSWQRPSFHATQV